MKRQVERRDYITDFTVHDCIAALSVNNVFDTFHYTMSDHYDQITFREKVSTFFVYGYGPNSYSIEWKSSNSHTCFRIGYIEGLVSFPMFDDELDEFFRIKMNAYPVRGGVQDFL